MKQAKLHHKEKKKKDEYTALFDQVDALKNKSISPEAWTVPQLNLMLRWYRRPEDAPLPTKKAERLVRYYEICARGDPLIPDVLTELPPKRAVPTFFLPASLPPLPTLTIESALVECASTASAKGVVEAGALDNRVAKEGAPIAEKVGVCCCGGNCELRDEELEEPDNYCYSCGGYCHDVCCIKELVIYFLF